VGAAGGQQARRQYGAVKFFHMHAFLFLTLLCVGKFL
jgi:hypothetical protein